MIQGPDARDAAVTVGGHDPRGDKPGEVWVAVGNTRLYWPSIDAAQQALFAIAGQLDLLRVTTPD